MAHYELAVRGGVLVLPSGDLVETDLGCTNGRIAAIGLGADDTADHLIDARGLHVLPGLIDAHVHFRDGGEADHPDIETMATGTRGAVLGGITAVFDMPNTASPAVDAERLHAKAVHVERVAWCDVGLYVGATATNADALGMLERLPGVAAIKVFAGSSTGDLLVADDAEIARVLASGMRRVAFHSEDEFRLRERRSLFAGSGDPDDHRRWRDEECAFLGTRRIVSLATRADRPVHILHVSTEEELDFLPAHRTVATVEVLVHHLTETAPECHERTGTLAVMNPPIRDARHRAAAWRAINDGRVDVVSSDHAPHPLAAKQRTWPATAAGLTGVQTIVPVMLDHVAGGRLTLARLVDLMAAGPARVYGVPTKGRVAVGFDADLTLVDLKARRVIEPAWLASPCGWSPHAGRRVTGWPVATVVRGLVVMRDGAVEGEASGRIVRFVP